MTVFDLSIIRWPTGTMIMYHLRSKLFYIAYAPLKRVRTVFILDNMSKGDTGIVHDLMYKIIEAVNSTANLDQLFPAIRHILGEFLDTTNFRIALYNKEKGIISLPYMIDEHDTYHRFVAGKTLTAYVIRQNKPLLLTPDLRDRLVQTGVAEPVGHPAKAWLGVPLKVKQDVIGAVVVQSYTDPTLYTDNDRKILELVSEQIGIAISRRQADDRLRESEQRFRSLVENSHSGIVIIDDKYRLIYVNAQMCQISGYAREELIGRDFRGFLDEDSKRLVSERYLLRQQGDEPPVRYEFNIICKNGEKRRVEISPSLIEDSKGNLRTVAQLLDITEQKLDEQKLKLSNSVLSAIRDINQLINRERNLHRLLQGTCYRLTSISSCESAWVVLLDDAGRIGSFAEAGLGPEFSSMIEKMQGGQLPPCGEKALSSPEVVTVEDPAAMCRNCPLAYNCVKRSVMTARLEHGSKTYGFIAVSLSGKLGLGGEGCALFGELARDIAFALHDAELEQKRVRTEDEIRALNQFRESIIENANVWIDVVDKEGNVLVWNKAAEQLSGYPHEVVVGDNKIWEWLYPDEAYREQVNAKLDQVLGQGQILENFETTIRCKDGTIKTISWNERNLTGIDGRATGSIAVGRDVTVHKQMEDEIESRRLYLEAVLATVPDALVTLDSDYRITEWSSGAERLFGYSRKEAIGRDIDELITMPEEIEQAKALSKLVLSGKYMPPTELVRYRKGGQPINVIFAGAPLLVRSKFIGAVAAYTEITARVEAEKKLRETSNKIERLHSIARQLEACSNEDDVYRLTVEAAEQILTFSMCSLDILEEGKLVVKATTSGLPPGASKEIGLEHWEHGGLAAKTFLSGESTVFGHLSEVPEARPTREDFKSGISAPIGDIGVFQVVSTEPGAFSEEDKRLLELLLGHTVEAVKRIRLQEALKEQAIHDALTGVYNRHFFNERIKEEVERSRRYSHPIAFIMLDVNRFKEINDRFGHLQGDRVLKMVADVLKKEVRDTDFVIRYGGDEFLIVLPETSNEADAVVQRVREALARRNEEQPIVEFPVTLGAGISHCDPGFERPLEEILTDADRRMYQDKKA